MKELFKNEIMNYGMIQSDDNKKDWIGEWCNNGIVKGYSDKFEKILSDRMMEPLNNWMVIVLHNWTMARLNCWMNESRNDEKWK